MKAIQLRAIHMINLIGKQVMTEPMGEYPGGVAKVTKLFPDPSAPEIVFQVKHPSFGRIGVFANEICDLV